MKNNRIFNGLLVLLIIVVTYLFLEYVGLLDNIWEVLGSLTPFIMGFALSWLLRPMGKFIHRKTKWSIKSSNIVAILISAVVLITMVFIVIPFIIIQIISLFDQAPAFIAGLEETITKVLNYFNIDINTIKEFINENKGSSIFKDIVNYIVAGVKGALSVILSTTGFILQFFFAYIIAFYFISDVDRFYVKLVGFIIPKHKEAVIDCSREMSHILFGYLRGLFLVCAIIFVFDAIGCTIIGVPAAFMLALLAAIFNVIPYLGPILGAIPIVIVALSVDVKTAFLSLFVVFGAQFVEANILQPKIMSDNTNLHPVTIIVGLTIFAALFGFIGMVISTPTLAMINVIMKHSPYDISI